MKTLNIKFYNQFMDYGFDSYISTFKKYINNNEEEYKKKVHILKLNLPTNSFYQAERFLRLVNLLPLPSSDFLIKKSVIYNQEELLEIKKEKPFYKDTNRIYKQYNLQGFEKIEINVFRHHCGLKLIKDQFQKKYQTKLESYLYNSNAIDGGAFFGDSALIVNKFYSPNKIYAFEPSTINYKCLQTTIANNDLHNKVIIEQKGLSDNVSRETLNYISSIQNHGASFVFKPQKLKTENIDLTTIDKYVKEQMIENIRLIKLDVEGYGLKAIKGAENTIIKNKPIISCGVYHNPEELFDILPLLKIYNPQYNFELLTLNHSFILKELTLMAY